jgi:hypothetical protein
VRFHPRSYGSYANALKSRGSGEATRKKYPFPGYSSTNQYDDWGNRRR